jgi:hypothetical protein
MTNLNMPSNSKIKLCSLETGRRHAKQNKGNASLPRQAKNVSNPSFSSSQFATPTLLALLAHS